MIIRKIIDEVIAQREHKFRKDRTITLSFVFYQEYLKETNEMISPSTKLFNIPDDDDDELGYNSQLTYNSQYGTDYIIRCRSYRDNSNDDDFERELIKALR